MSTLPENLRKISCLVGPLIINSSWPQNQLTGVLLLKLPCQHSCHAYGGYEKTGIGHSQITIMHVFVLSVHNTFRGVNSIHLKIIIYFWFLLKQWLPNWILKITFWCACDVIIKHLGVHVNIIHSCKMHGRVCILLSSSLSILHSFISPCTYIVEVESLPKEFERMRNTISRSTSIDHHDSWTFIWSGLLMHRAETIS